MPLKKLNAINFNWKWKKRARDRDSIDQTSKRKKELKVICTWGKGVECHSRFNQILKFENWLFVTNSSLYQMAVAKTWINTYLYFPFTILCQWLVMLFLLVPSSICALWHVFWIWMLLAWFSTFHVTSFIRAVFFPHFLRLLVRFPVACFRKLEFFGWKFCFLRMLFRSRVPIQCSALYELHANV